MRVSCIREGWKGSKQQQQKPAIKTLQNTHAANGKAEPVRACTTVRYLIPFMPTCSRADRRHIDTTTSDDGVTAQASAVWVWGWQLHRRTSKLAHRCVRANCHKAKQWKLSQPGVPRYRAALTLCNQLANRLSKFDQTDMKQGTPFSPCVSTP